MPPRLASLALCRSIQGLAFLTRGDAANDLELLVLRHQLAVLRRQTPHPKLAPADRALLAAVSRALPQARWSCFVVTPETLRQHRRLVAGAWTSPRRGQDDRRWTVTWRSGSSGWPGSTLAGGYQRIHGELLRLDVVVSASTIRAMLRRHGLDPAPRRAGTTWRAFLRRQAAGIVACDCFSVDTVWLRRLCAVLHRARHPAGPSGRGDRPSR